ncbi:hypothetical protein ACHAXS_002776 [Conticribra weissflogii]
MGQVTCTVKDTDIYLDNIGVFSTNWEHHIELFDKIFHRPEANGFVVNLLKSKWASQETNWFGYWLRVVPTDLKPLCKIDRILEL